MGSNKNPEGDGSFTQLGPAETCPFCGADLKQPGAIRVIENFPEVMGAHLEAGASGSIVVVDRARAEISVDVQCSECSGDLHLDIEEFVIDPDCEVDDLVNEDEDTPDDYPEELHDD